MDDRKSTENISGGPAGSSFAEFVSNEADTPAEEVVKRLGELYCQ